MHVYMPFIQDLTRLKVPVAYLKHMFEDIMQGGRPGKPKMRFMDSLDSASSSFDYESERGGLVSRLRQRDSTGRSESRAEGGIN